jgi:hypothetical protein
MGYKDGDRVTRITYNDHSDTYVVSTASGSAYIIDGVDWRASTSGETGNHAIATIALRILLAHGYFRGRSLVDDPYAKDDFREYL